MGSGLKTDTILDKFHDIPIPSEWAGDYRAWHKRNREKELDDLEDRYDIGQISRWKTS